MNCVTVVGDDREIVELIVRVGLNFIGRDLNGITKDVGVSISTKDFFMWRRSEVGLKNILTAFLRGGLLLELA